MGFLRLPRGLKAALEALRVGGSLLPGEIRYATDEARAYLASDVDAMKAILAVSSLGTSGQVLTSNGSGSEPTFQEANKLRAINSQSGTSYALALSDGNTIVEMTAAAANMITVPPNVFPVGTQIEIWQYGTGKTTIAAGSGVTLRSADGKLAVAKQYAAATIFQRAANEWAVVGNLS